MSVAMTKVNGVTVLTLNSDPQSACPPLCQILKALCYSPVCCSLSQHLRRVQGTSQSALGALQIMVALLSIGLASVLYNIEYWVWFVAETGFPYWCGAVSILFGTVSILSEKFPSRCLVVINVILNLVGVAFAITAIVLYCICMAEMYGNMCYDVSSYSPYYDEWYDHPRVVKTTSSPEKVIMKQRCLEGQALTKMLCRSIIGVLIVMSLLELCLFISSAVLGIKALRTIEKEGNKNPDEPELYKPFLEEVTTNPTA